jgi:putative transposase
MGRWARRLWGGTATGRNPTDRGTGGVTRRVRTDGRGIPLGRAIAIAGANRPDDQLLGATVGSIPIPQPAPTPAAPPHRCLDNGSDDAAGRSVALAWGSPVPIRPRGEEATARQAGQRARRWVVERTPAWRQRFRRIRIRWDKQPGNDLACLPLAGARSTFRACSWHSKLSG